LCNEFVSTEVTAKLSEFRSSMDFKETKPKTETEAETKAEDADTRGRIAVLEETATQHSHINAILQDKVTRLSTWR
jgi:hypothetical protein